MSNSISWLEIFDSLNNKTDLTSKIDMDHFIDNNRIKYYCSISALNDYKVDDIKEVLRKIVFKITQIIAKQT